TMAGHEMRGAAADAPVAGRIAKRGADGWMPAQTQIVVAAKVDEPPALDHDLRRIRPGARKFRETLHRSARAPEMLPPGSREGVRERSGTGSSRAASLGRVAGRVAGSGSVERVVSVGHASVTARGRDSRALPRCAGSRPTRRALALTAPTPRA